MEAAAGPGSTETAPPETWIAPPSERPVSEEEPPDTGATYETRTFDPSEMPSLSETLLLFGGDVKVVTTSTLETGATYIRANAGEIPFAITVQSLEGAYHPAVSPESFAAGYEVLPDGSEVLVSDIGSDATSVQMVSSDGKLTVVSFGESREKVEAALGGLIELARSTSGLLDPVPAIRAAEEGPR